MIFGVSLAEMGISLKFNVDAGNIENTPTPIYKWLPTLIVVVCAALYFLYLRFKPGHTVKYIDTPANSPDVSPANNRGKKQKKH